jgi:NADH dehydrogenase
MEPLIACLPCEKDQRLRLIVNEYLELQDYPNIWSLGDCALIPDVKKPGQYMPPTAQNAVREARVAAKNILAVVRNQPEKREVFSYQPIGEFVMLGEHSAVAVIKGHKLKGILAWVLWRTFYLWRLPSWPKKIRVALDWLIDAFTARDTTQIKLLPTELVESKIQEIEEGKPMGRTEPFKYRHTA